MNYWTQSKDNVYVAAHRGWSEKYPENTMPAFKAAVALGVDQIETDVRVTKDGELVIIHDETVGRTTDSAEDVKVIDLTLAEIKALDAGIKKGEEFKGERIPTFIEFMDYIKSVDLKTIDIELKVTPATVGEELAYSVCDRILKIIDDYGYTDRCVINSFSGQLQEYVRNKYGNKYRQHVYFPVGCNGTTTIDPYSYAYCCCMFGTGGAIMADAADFEKMEARGVECWAGAAVKDEESVDMMLERGATLVTCNNPDVVLDLLRKKGKHE